MTEDRLIRAGALGEHALHTRHGSALRLVGRAARAAVATLKRSKIQTTFAP
jgi:hypothetical protein